MVLVADGTAALAAAAAGPPVDAREPLPPPIAAASRTVCCFPGALVRDEISGERDMARPGTIARSKEQVLEHYQIEKELAQKLRHASREERRGLVHRGV